MSVIDASVLGASENIDELGHAVSRAFLRAASVRGERLSAPTIIVPEFASALLRKGVDPSAVTDGIAAFLRVASLALRPVTIEFATRAAELVATLGLRGCDAVYVALAESLGEDLVTLGREQLRRAAAVVVTRAP